MNLANANLTYDAAGLELTEVSEGLRLIPYQDVRGIWTEGYGHTGLDVHPGIPITQLQAALLLMHDVDWAVSAVKSLVVVPLTQNQFNALVDFTFNVGSTQFQGSTLLKMVNAKNFVGAGAQFLLWNKAGGKVVQGLINRRQAESHMFLL